MVWTSLESMCDQMLKKNPPKKKKSAKKKKKSANLCRTMAPYRMARTFTHYHLRQHNGPGTMDGSQQRERRHTSILQPILIILYCSGVVSVYARNFERLIIAKLVSPF